jgi:hypothetical protein
MGAISWISKHTPLPDTDFDLSNWAGKQYDNLSGKSGMDTAAQGARDAQKQSNELAALQWQRQMQGLQEARGATQPYLSLYDKIYGTQTAGHVPQGGMGGPLGGGGRPQGPVNTPLGGWATAGPQRNAMRLGDLYDQYRQTGQPVNPSSVPQPNGYAQAPQNDALAQALAKLRGQRPQGGGF